MSSRTKRRAYVRGIIAESIAAFYFLCQGYAIIGRRYKTPVGEIDLIAASRKRIIFIEVKQRKHSAHITRDPNVLLPSQQQRITRAAEYFLQKFPAYAQRECRFDFMLFIGVKPTHIRNAFL